MNTWSYFFQGLKISAAIFSYLSVDKFIHAVLKFQANTGIYKVWFPLPRKAIKITKVNITCHSF